MERAGGGENGTGEQMVLWFYPQVLRKPALTPVL